MVAKRTHIIPCIDCDKPMRPRTALLRDWPGTVIEKAKGYCSTCDEKNRIARQPRKDKTPPAPETMTAHREFLAARNRRLQADLRRQKVRMVTK